MGVSLMMGALGGAARAGEDLADRRIDQINRSEYAAERDAANIRFQQMANDFANQRMDKAHAQKREDTLDERQYNERQAAENFRNSVDLNRIEQIENANNHRTKVSLMGAANYDSKVLDNEKAKRDIERLQIENARNSMAENKVVSEGGGGGSGERPKHLNFDKVDAKLKEFSGMKNALTSSELTAKTNAYADMLRIADDYARKNPDATEAQVALFARDQYVSTQTNTTGAQKGEDNGIVMSRNAVFDDVGAARSKAPDGDIGKLEVGTVIKRGDGKLPVRLMPNGKWEEIIPGMDRRPNKEEATPRSAPANIGTGRTHRIIQTSPAIPRQELGVSLMSPGARERDAKIQSQIQDNASRAVTPEPMLAPVPAGSSEINQQPITDVRAARDAGNAEIEKMIAERRAEKTPTKPATQSVPEQSKSEWEEVTRLNERKIVDEFGQGIPFEEKAANEQRMRELVQQIAKRSGTNWRDIAKRVDSDYASLRQQARSAFERDGERAVGISGANQSVTEDAPLPPAEGMKQRAEEPKPAAETPPLSPLPASDQTPENTATPEPAQPEPEPRAMPEQLPPEQDMKGIRDELYGRMSLLHGKIVEDKAGKQSKELAAEREALIQEIAEKTNMPVDEVRKNADENLDLQKAFWADDDTEKTRSSKLIVDSAESTLDKIEKLIEQGSSPDDFIPEIESAQKNIREHGAEPKPRKLIPSKFK